MEQLTFEDAADDERWLPVDDFPFYEVSSLGRIRRLPQLQPRILAASPNSRGYRAVTLSRPGAKATGQQVHRLVMNAFVGPLPDGLVVRHLDGNKNNNALSNLTYGTYADNAHDPAVNGICLNANKTHCKHGHPFSRENTYLTPSGSRHCRACNRAAAAKRRATRRAADANRAVPHAPLSCGTAQPEPALS